MKLGEPRYFHYKPSLLNPYIKQTFQEALQNKVAAQFKSKEKKKKPLYIFKYALIYLHQAPGKSIQIFWSGWKKKKEQTLSTSEYFSTFYLGATLGTFVSGPIALIRERAWGISPLQVGQSG